MKNDHRVGKRFGSMTVLKRIAGSPTNRVRYLCRCDCGNERKVYLSNLYMIKGCGCIRERHGCSDTKAYQVWTNLRYREYPISKRWQDSFETFLKDVGHAPTKKHRFIRINRSKPYTLANVEWRAQ